MELEKEILDLPVTKVLIGFCPNPTPFKSIAQLPESCKISDIVEVFANSENKKRKVISIMTQQGEWQIGENELHIYINRYKNSLNPLS